MIMGTDFGFIRKRIKDRQSLQRLEEIKKDWALVRKKGKIIKSKKTFPIKIGKYTFWLRKNGASSSVDTYLEMFKKNGHMTLPEFKGRKDKVVLDLGANEGYYVTRMKDNNPRLKIIAVEPVPQTFALLKKNIAANRLKNVIPVNAAITSKTGRITFEVIPEITVVGGLDIVVQKRPWLDVRRVQKITVNSITLPLLCKKMGIRKIDILKMDVEGSELEILKSSKELLKDISKIVIEWHSEKLRDDCISFLSKNGFKLVNAEKRKCGDLYFVRK